MAASRHAEPCAAPLLSLQGISKSFSGVRALKSVDLDLFPGEIIGLVGDNGAGKSTLIKILSGVHAPDAGRLFVGGRPVDFQTYDVRQARRLGIETVFQDRSLGEKQPLWRNIFVGRPITNRLGFIRVREQKRATLEILRHQVGLPGAGIDVDGRVRTLSGGERQGLAIGRAMYFEAAIIILDEPTTALSLKEVDKVLAFVDRIVRQGKACIYISHNMQHVYRLAHRVVVMDRGAVAGEYLKKELSLEQLGARLMRIAAAPGGNRAS
ncbi:MAG: ATP-binding cassette domain-containing protein [Desulfobacterales bacterium]|jgi:simple sugar transport system ATP-binding protein|nr:ATP-binding cassette domain-containing protein [Desulfobacterales bacterium]